MRLFRNPVFTVCSVLSFIVGFAMLGAMTFLPTYLQYVDGDSATVSGRAHPAHGHRPAHRVDLQRQRGEQDRPVPDLPHRRRTRDGGGPLSAVADGARRRRGAGIALHVRARPRHRAVHAGAHHRRAEHRRLRGPGHGDLRASPSSARWAARSAPRSSAPSTPTPSSRTSRPGWPRPRSSAARPRPSSAKAAQSPAELHRLPPAASAPDRAGVRRQPAHRLPVDRAGGRGGLPGGALPQAGRAARHRPVRLDRHGRRVRAAGARATPPRCSNSPSARSCAVRT